MSSMNIPADLSAETLAWIRLQMTLAAARAVEPLKVDLKRSEDFANGLFLVVAQVLPYLLLEHPDLAARLAPHWKKDAARFAALDAGAAPKDDEESLDLLEARSILYAMGVDLDLWPRSKQKGSVRVVTRAKRA